MWRIAAAMTRGGNLCGGWWQRPQFARNRFSPSRRAIRSSLESPRLDWGSGASCIRTEGAIATAEEVLEDFPGFS